MVLGLITVMALSSHPVLAMGHGMGGRGGGGSGMMGNWGESIKNWWQEWQNRRAYQNPAGEQRREREELEQKYRRETGEMTRAIGIKSAELDDLLNSPSPDMERVRTLRNEIKGLRAELEERRIKHDREIHEFDPAAPYGGGYNRRTYEASQALYGPRKGHGGGQY